MDYPSDPPSLIKIPSNVADIALSPALDAIAQASISLFSVTFRGDSQSKNMKL